jgi:hypothetical protein
VLVSHALGSYAQKQKKERIETSKKEKNDRPKIAEDKTR